MKQLIVVSVLFFLNLCLSLGQGVIQKPILVDKSVLSGVGLEKIELKNEPEKQFYQKQLYRGNDISVYVVSTQTWNNVITKYPFDEYVYLLNGQSIIKPNRGNSQVFNSGDHLFTPKGFEGEWEIRAGENLHYELSVITTKRADSTKVAKDLGYKYLSSSILSGCQVSFKEENKHKEFLHQGVELTVTFQAEKPREERILNPMKEKLIHVLAGQISFVDESNQEHIFYTGDFFIIPTGLKGVWKSAGHGIIKYMIIEKSI